MVICKEKRLANGLRKGNGGKRFAKLQEVGFTKNFTQLFRLAQVGVEFFTSSRFVVDTREFETTVDGFSSFHEFLMSVKVTPENHTVEELNRMTEVKEAELVAAYENRSQTFKFNENKLNKALLELYFPVLQQQMEK